MEKSKDGARNVNTLRVLLDGGVPLVAVSFYDRDGERLAREARSAGVDIAELRIDQFSNTTTDHVLAQVREFRHLPVLATVRSEHEGGGWRGTEVERLDLFRAVMPFAAAVDIELSSREILHDVVATARQHDVMVIVSHHDFERTPDVGELEAVVGAAQAAGADIVKVSTMARSVADVKRLASLLVNADDGPELIVIAMGATGTVSRVFFPALGSRITYSFIGDRPSPGQLEFTETFRLLRQFYPEFDRRKITELALVENA